MITKHIPNSITCCNLISGCIAISYGFYGQQDMALLWIITGAVFDFFDGMTARLLHVSSPIGKELDSLADVVTFGVAPSTMLFTYMSQLIYPSFLEDFSQYIPYIAYLMAVFSALRLAKFNLDERQTISFIGLPTPANALFWGALIVGGGEHADSLPHTFWIILLLIFYSCYILVAEIPLFALKFKTWGWKENSVRYLFLLSCIPMLVFLRIIAIPFIIVWYVSLSRMTAKR